jgi:hypothetical protein
MRELARRLSDCEKILILINDFEAQSRLRNDGGSDVGKSDRDNVPWNAMPMLHMNWDVIDRDNPFAPCPRSLWLGQTEDVAQDRTNSPDRVPAVGSHQRNRACQMPNCIYGRPFSQSPDRT